MSATIIKTEAKGITIETFIPIPEGKNDMGMLEREELILKGINRTGQVATQYALSQFDTDGAPITVNEKKQTSKGQVAKAYQTPYGEIVLFRHVYQTNEGGCTFCPLDNDARIISGTTPKLAKMIGSKYSESCAMQVKKDMEDNHGRHLSKQYIQALSQSIGNLIAEKKNWDYTIDVSGESVATIGVSLDGACMLLFMDGDRRRALVGSISLYSSCGERLYTRYTALFPEQGNAQFHQSFEQEIKHVRKLYPKSFFVGVVDGSPANFSFLESLVDEQILDFFHAAEHLSKASKAAFNLQHKSNEWYQSACHTLKNEEDGAALIIKELESLLSKRMNDRKKEQIESSITFLNGHIRQMDYYSYRQKCWPISSGVMETAGELIIKQRLCSSGMRWTDNGAGTVLALRCFNKSDKMWKQFWNKINKYGY